MLGKMRAESAQLFPTFFTTTIPPTEATSARQKKQCRNKKPQKHVSLLDMRTNLMSHYILRLVFCKTPIFKTNNNIMQLFHSANLPVSQPRFWCSLLGFVNTILKTFSQTTANEDTKTDNTVSQYILAQQTTKHMLLIIDTPRHTLQRTLKSRLPFSKCCPLKVKGKLIFFLYLHFLRH